MKYRNYSSALLVIIALLLSGCAENMQSDRNIRPLADTIGFAQYDHQMDEVMGQVTSLFGERIQDMLTEAGISGEDSWKLAICPHDDYAYAGFMYPAALRNVKARVVILIGVAHRARELKLEDQLIFDSYSAWQGPYGRVNVSEIREELIERLPLQLFQVNDSMQRMEHSLEALVPFLQYQDRNVEIVPILLPYMPYEKMNSIAMPLADAIYQVVNEQNLEWGKDFAIVISNDAVHYGDEGWGGTNFARFGADSSGYEQAMNHERSIIDAITGELMPSGIHDFCNYTVQEENYKEYKWAWCGRYAVPFGLLTGYHLNHLYSGNPLKGYPIGYATSIDHKPLEVEHLGMGVTAPANLRHWVGYAAIGYK